MNTMNENAQAMTQATITSLTEAVTAIATQLKDLVDLAKAESTVAVATTTEVTTTETTATTTTEATTATETTATTEAPTTATTPIVVIDDDDNVIATSETTTETTTADVVEFKGSMNEQDPMDPIPAVSEAKADDTAEAEETVPADEDAAEEYLDNIIADISALYNITEYALRHEGKNIESDRSPYAPKENKVGAIGDYRVFISKEFTKCDHVEGSFRIIIKDKCIVDPIMDLDLHLIDNHFKMISSENTSRMEKMKESHDLMRFMEIVEEVSNLVMSKYISD